MHGPGVGVEIGHDDRRPRMRRAARPPRSSSQGRSVAQCATSSRAGPPSASARSRGDGAGRRRGTRRRPPRRRRRGTSRPPRRRRRPCGRSASGSPAARTPAAVAGSRPGGEPGQLGQGHRLGQLADPADAAAVAGGRAAGRAGTSGRGVSPSRAASASETPGLATSALVCATYSATPAADQPVDDAALVGVGRDRRDRLSSSGWWATIRSAPLGEGLLDGLGHAVDDAQDRVDRVLEIAQHQTHPVPRSAQSRG